MEIQSQRELICLDEIEKDKRITQRKLANRLGVALGLTNILVKRLAKKGYLKITTLPRNRLKYVLTPAGIMAKSRLSYEFLRYSIIYIGDIRNRFSKFYQELTDRGASRVLFYGAGEAAEIAFICLQGYPLELIGIVDDKKAEQRFLGHVVLSSDQISGLEFDCLLITQFDSIEPTRERLIAKGVPASRIPVF